jgi:zinc protease
VLGSLMSSARYGRPLDYAATLTERYEALTLPDLQAEAVSVVHPESLIWIVVGDLSQIRSQVERLGIAPVEIWDDSGRPQG